MHTHPDPALILLVRTSGGAANAPRLVPCHQVCRRAPPVMTCRLLHPTLESVLNICAA
jgi:hypothetical protein